MPLRNGLSPSDYRKLIGQLFPESGRKFFSVEGSNRPRRHRHVTISPSKHQDINDSGDVTKIELELEEAPDDTILVGSMPSELDAAAEINSTYPDGLPGPGTVVVRAEEALIVILVLVLWVAAIALFFNRWGKIRMLEPYQPKFQQQHRQSCAMIEQNPLQKKQEEKEQPPSSTPNDSPELNAMPFNCSQHRSYSKFNIHCAEHPAGYQAAVCASGQSRPRQNSVFVGSSASLLPACQDTPRRTKSAFDLQSLVLAECNVQDDRDERETETFRSSKLPNECSKLLQRDRRTSVCQADKSEIFKTMQQRERGMSICQFDRNDAILSRPLQRDRGMSICQFDRMDVLARPLQRERGMSICQFDRMDVLARPLQGERGSSCCHFDRMDVLARPSPCLGKSFLAERRVSVCNFTERDEEAGRGIQRDRRLSVSNVDRIESISEFMQKDRGAGGTERQEIFAKCQPKETGSSAVYHYDRPSCSKTPDVVLGYKATCV